MTKLMKRFADILLQYKFASHWKEAFSCDNNRTADQRKEE